MDFSDPPRRPLPGSIVPMINVVFLLLIFFLMTAQIAPPVPFEVAPPAAGVPGDPIEAELTIHLAADGTPAYLDDAGPAALEALRQARAELCAGAAGCAPPLVLRADGAAEGAAVARLMAQLAGIGFAKVQLVTVPK